MANAEIQSKALDDTNQRIRHVESLLSDLKEDEIYRRSLELTEEKNSVRKLDVKSNNYSVATFSSTEWAIVFYYLEMDNKEGNKLDRIKDFIKKKSVITVYGKSPSPKSFNANVLKIGKQITGIDKYDNEINRKVYPPFTS